MTTALNSSFQQTLTTLATAADIVANVVQATAGNNVGPALKGQPVTLDMIRSLAMARIQRNLSAHKVRT